MNAIVPPPPRPPAAVDPPHKGEGKKERAARASLVPQPQFLDQRLLLIDLLHRIGAVVGRVQVIGSMSSLSMVSL